MDFTSIANQLGKTGLCVWPHFLSPESLIEIRADLNSVQRRQGFHRAGTGQGKGHEVRDLVRSDDGYWLKRENGTPAQVVLWSKIDSLRRAFNRILFLGLLEFEGQYAIYQAGGFYKRHLDTFQHDNARVVSVVIYLNADWIPADGGMLRVYDEKSHVDIAPTGGTLVCFLSGESEHEVLPSHATRLSFTGWFKSSPMPPASFAKKR